MVSLLRPPRFVIPLAVVVVLLITVSNYYPTARLVKDGVDAVTGAGGEGLFPTQQSNEGATDPSTTDDTYTDSAGPSAALRKATQQAALSIDTHSVHAEWAINLGDLNLDSYIAHLRSIKEEFFEPSPYEFMDQTLEYLSFDSPPYTLGQVKARPIPKNIFTTDITPPSEFPPQFAAWTKRNRQWNVLYVDDDEMDRWLGKLFPGLAHGSIAATKASTQAGVVREFKALRKKHGIVRADLFRCVVSFLPPSLPLTPPRRHTFPSVHTYLALLRPLHHSLSPIPSHTSTVY